MRASPPKESETTAAPVNKIGDMSALKKLFNKSSASKAAQKQPVSNQDEEVFENILKELDNRIEQAEKRIRAKANQSNMMLSTAHPVYGLKYTEEKKLNPNYEMNF